MGCLHKAVGRGQGAMVLDRKHYRSPRMLRPAGDIYGMNLAGVAARDTMLLRTAHSTKPHYRREGHMRTKLLLVSVFAAFAAAVMLPVPAAAESTWDQIKRTGKLRYGAIDYPPNWYRDKTSGKWTGFLVEMVEDLSLIHI